MSVRWEMLKGEAGDLFDWVEKDLDFDYGLEESALCGEEDDQEEEEEEDIRLMVLDIDYLLTEVNVSLNF